MTDVKKIVIVGGGTAGWLTAGLLASYHDTSKLSITLIESPSIQPISVGEGTWPTMRQTLQRIGVSEAEFINECNVAFKQSSCFVGWKTGESEDRYFHPFTAPEQYLDFNLANHWQQYKDKVSFSKAVSYQEQLCLNGLAPKMATTPEYQGQANYGYHLDSAKFSAFLKQFCIANKGIRFISDDMVAVKSASNGDIDAIICKEHGEISGDLFIDCTGFKSLLLGEHFNVPFLSKSDQLFVNKALAVQQMYPEEEFPIACHTISTAQSAGWIWDIGLQTRRGVGYVYSTHHESDEQALENLYCYLGDDTLAVREIPINSGHRKEFWHKNCVAVGLSAGFLEPLEASALVMIELSATTIAEQLPKNRRAMSITAKRFNETFLYRWERIIDFLKLHYLLSERQESFWRDNRELNTVSAQLNDLLALWQVQTPWHFDLPHANEIFSAASYQYVLYGMGFHTQINESLLGDNQQARAQQAFQNNMSLTKKMLDSMPNHRTLLNNIGKHGLSRI